MSPRTMEAGDRCCRLDLGLLQAFIAVAQEGQIGRAARRLAMTQSPLSRQILRLEHGLGVRLFERQRNGVRMTPAGQVLFREAPKLLRQSELIARRTRAAALDAKLCYPNDRVLHS